MDKNRRLIGTILNKSAGSLPSSPKILLPFTMGFGRRGINARDSGVFSTNQAGILALFDLKERS